MVSHLFFSQLGLIALAWLWVVYLSPADTYVE